MLLLRLQKNQRGMRRRRRQVTDRGWKKAIAARIARDQTESGPFSKGPLFTGRVGGVLLCGARGGQPFRPLISESVSSHSPSSCHTSCTPAATTNSTRIPADTCAHTIAVHPQEHRKIVPCGWLPASGYYSWHSWPSEGCVNQAVQASICSLSVGGRGQPIFNKCGARQLRGVVVVQNGNL